MLINGEKYACEACVRGHRVSNCQHSDRQLQHINKKGRPVSQCQHCRAMRKSRSAHTKCDCGEKMFKCAHLKSTAEGHTDSCCCNHGGRFTCCHKKELSHLATVPETISPKDGAAPAKVVKGPIRNRRRANTIHAEGIFSFDENGNRTSKHAAASKQGEPYQVGRSNSVYGLHSSSATESPMSLMPLGSGEFAADPRKSKSEAASPLMMGSAGSAHLNGQLPPLDLASLDCYNWPGNKLDFYGGAPPDFEQPMFSAGSVDWSHYDGLEFAGRADVDFAPSNYSQPQSYGAPFDVAGSEQLPTLTTSTSTSGEASEVEDLMPTNFDDLDMGGAGFRATAVEGGFDVAQICHSLLGNADLATLNYDEFKMIKAGTQFLPTPPSLAGDETGLVSNGSSGLGDFSQTMVDDNQSTWMGSDYAQGFPAQEFQLPLNETPDGSSMATFWGTA